MTIYLNEVTNRYISKGEPWWEARVDDAVAAISQSPQAALGKLVDTHPDLFHIILIDGPYRQKGETHGLRAHVLRVLVAAQDWWHSLGGRPDHFRRPRSRLQVELAKIEMLARQIEVDARGTSVAELAAQIQVRTRTLLHPAAERML